MSRLWEAELYVEGVVTVTVEADDADAAAEQAARLRSFDSLTITDVSVESIDPVAEPTEATP